MFLSEIDVLRRSELLSTSGGVNRDFVQTEKPDTEHRACLSYTSRFSIWFLHHEYRIPHQRRFSYPSTTLSPLEQAMPLPEITYKPDINTYTPYMFSRIDRREGGCYVYATTHPLHKNRKNHVGNAAGAR